jgi:ribose 5-phosphate isomerase A
MNQAELKRLVGAAALDHVRAGTIVGVGTGSTVNYFIDSLIKSGIRIDAAVSSSAATTRLLTAGGIRVLDLYEAGDPDVYIDGADEFDAHRRLIKGGGGALTREKIVAAASRKFVCIADQGKQVKVLGRFPLPLEVIPMARGLVARQMVALGGRPVWREGFTTDNGNCILDVHDLDLTDPVNMEQTINNLAGVVTCGLFALRPANLVLCATQNGIRQV